MRAPLIHKQSVDEDCVPEERRGTTVESARSDLSALRLRQVGSSARRLRHYPFDGPSARMKCHWRAFFELSELSAESLRQVARTRKSPWNGLEVVLQNMRKTTSSGARPKCAQSAIPSPGSLETSPTELHDHTSRYTTTGPLPCKVRRLTHRMYHRRPSIALYAGTSTRPCPY